MNRTSRVCRSLSYFLMLLAIVCVPVAGWAATTVATPTFGKAAGSYVGTQSVTLSDATSGATIYYTTNGTTPTSSSTKYTAAISVSTSETIEAIAELSGDTNSAVASAAYTITVPTPTFGLAAGSYVGTQSVTLSDATSGASIYYTTNGSTPSSSSTRYTGAISVSTSETIKAIAELTGDTNSAVASAAYTITVSTPTFSPAAGTYTSTQSVSLSDATTGATIYYTTNGNTPTTGSTQYTSAISVPVTETIKALAVLNGATNSAVASATYTIPLSVTVSPATVGVGAGGTQQFTATVVGSTNTAVTWSLSPTTGAGSINTTSGLYTAPATVTTPQTVTITATSQANTSVKGTATLTLKATPTLSVASSKNPSTYGGSVTFTATISSGPTGSVTFFDGSTSLGTGTISGTTATLSTTSLAGGTHSITANWGGNTNYSAVTSSAITQTVNKATPTLSVASSKNPSTYGGSVTLTATISSGPTGSVTFFDGSTSLGSINLSGTTAALTTTSLAAGSHSITANWGGNTNYSAVTSSIVTQTVNKAALTITASSPTVPYGSPVPGITPGYSGWVNGDTPSSLTTQPTCTTTYTPTSAVGSSPSTSCSGAVDANYSISYVSGKVTVIKATPTLSVASSKNPSNYGDSVTFTATISSGLTGLSLTFYDGSTSLGTGTISGTTATLTTASLAVGSHSITVKWAGNTNYNAVTSSPITQTVIVATTPTPTFSLAAGNYPTAQIVTISDTNAAATIYYTLGNPGTTPGTSSNVYTGGALTISSSETLEAVAVSAGTSSSVATATYTLPPIANSMTTLAVTSGGSPVTSVNWPSVVKLTATVTSGTTAVTTGTVNFCDATATYCTGIHLLGTAQLTSAGTAAINLQPGIGSHSYIAKFVGTSSYETSSSSLSQLTVTGSYPTTTTILGTSGSAGDYTLTAQVAAMGDNTVAPTGTVSIVDTSNANVVLGTASLSGATAALALANASTPGTGNFPYFVAVGDFNGDGIPDLAVINLYDSTVTILLGTGGGAFQPAPNSPITVGRGTISVAVGDFNGDGIPDLAVVNSTDNTVAILLGNGDGTFRAAPNSPITGVSSFCVVVGDFNGDGKLDLIVPNGNTVTVLLGNGDGSFTPAATSSATLGNLPDSAAVGDFNGDGKPDLAVANYHDGTVSILLGNGDGTFTEAPYSPVTVGNGPRPIALVDSRGIGKLDLVTLNSYTVAILLGNGDGTFQPPATIVGTSSVPVGSFAVGDFNEDGIPDLAVGLGYYFFGTYYNAVSILPGDGTGAFGVTNNDGGISLSFSPGYIAAADFNGDGIPDLAVANVSNNTLSILQTSLETATATATGIAPVGSGTHNVDASYGGGSTGNASFAASVSATTPLMTVADIVSAISPLIGPTGTLVTITGMGFGSAQGTNSVTIGGISAVATQWSDTQIQAQVPNGLGIGPQSVVVTVGGQSGVGAFTFTVTPGINVITPSSEAPGTSVTITGTNFGATQGTSTVAFNGTAATSISNWSAISFVAVVPTGATTGNVVVTVGGLASNGSWFTVLATPSIASLSVTLGAVNTPVTITGTSFGTTMGTVTFNGTPATMIANWTDTSIQTSVPTGATTGNVVVTAGGVASNGLSFTVVVAPSITTLSPTSGAVGAWVTISGSNFGTAQGTVTFNGTPATSITGWATGSILAQVPTGATTGNVVVTAGGVASNGVSFTVAPGITNLSVTSGEVSTPVTITGTNFGTTQGAVTFNGTPATITNWTDTSILTSVPTGATTGNVVVTAGGVASTGVAFTVLTVTLTSSANPSSYGGSVIFAATFSTSGLTGPVTFTDSGTQIGAGTITGTTAIYKTSSLAVGTHSITASWPGNPTYPPMTSSPVLQTVQNTPAVYSWPWPSDITFGQTLASSQLIGGSAAVSGTFAWTAPGTIPPVGAPTESMTFTPSDTTDYSSATGSVAVTVDPIESPAPSTSVTYTYDNLGRVYQAQYSTSSGTITVTYSYDSAGNRTSVVTQ